MIGLTLWLGDLGGTTRPSTAPPAPQVRPIIPIKSHGARPEDSRDPRPHRPLLVSQTLPYSCSQPQSHPSLFFFSSTNSLQPSRCLTPPVSIESPPSPPSHQTHPQRPGWATHWAPPALTSQGSLQSTVSAQDDSEWMRRAVWSSGGPQPGSCYPGGSFAPGWRSQPPLPTPHPHPWRRPQRRCKGAGQAEAPEGLEGEEGLL